MSRLRACLAIVLCGLTLSSLAADQPTDQPERSARFRGPTLRSGPEPVAAHVQSSGLVQTETSAGSGDLRPMQQSTIDHIQAHMNRVNAQERKSREDYYAYLLQQGDNTQTLEQFMDQFASFASFGEAASESDIEQLQLLSGPRLPAALVQFYRTLGAVDGGNHLHRLVIDSPEILVKHSAADVAHWQRVSSIGLVDAIIRSWGGDRFEFVPSRGGVLTEDEVIALNSRYSVIGWHDVEDVEGFKYLFFDADGKFGTLHYHQDEFDEFYSDDLKPMLQVSSADQSFDAALMSFVESAAGSDALDEDEE